MVEECGGELGMDVVSVAGESVTNKLTTSNALVGKSCGLDWGKIDVDGHLIPVWLSVD